MNAFIPPILNRDIACIVSNDVDLELISTVSSYLNCESVYYPMFRMPSVRYRKNYSLKLGNDDYMSNVIAQKASRIILNSIAKAGCKTIIVVGLDENQLSYLELENYFKLKIVYINSNDEILEKLAFIGYDYKGILKCKREDIANGLYIAKKNNMLLMTDESSDKVDSLIQYSGNGIIIVEKNNDLSDIIITNYAVATGADIKFINAVDESQIDDFNLNLLKWKRDNSYGSYLRIERFVNEVLGEIGLEKYKYITFFTDGIPYGVLFNEITCCSHVLRSIAEDVFIFNNLLYETIDTGFDSALIFSPEPIDLGDLVVDEANTVKTLLSNNKFWVKLLRKNQATVKAFDQNVGNYPYDILHIVSHGGETKGYYVEQEFFDRNGEKHKIEYEEVVGFSPEDSKVVQVTSKQIFKYFDNLPWRSKELEDKNYPKYVYDDMLKAITDKTNDAKINRVKVDYLIEKSCHVQCYDSIHQGQFHFVASNNTPLIFNNTCTSWKEFSTQLIAAGCRAYIGTLWNINNEVAFNSAKLFYSKVYDIPIISIVNEMLKNINNEKYKDIYIFCGLHFSTLRKPKVKSNEKIFNELIYALNRWNLYISAPKEKSLLINAIKIIKFICIQLTPYYMRPGVMELIVKSLLLSDYIEKNIKYDEIE